MDLTSARIVRFVASLGLAMLVAAGGLVGCSGQTCTPGAAYSCQEGSTWSLDSCGNREYVSKTCDCGCKGDGSGCATCVCEPDCAGKQCGDDGCGSACPPGCQVYETCDADGQCTACQPDCAGRECGSDGCGGTCDPGCGPGEGCDPDGQCVPCEPACNAKQCGPDGCGGVCAPGCDPSKVCDGAGHCVACVPNCLGRQCGPDGCGGVCAPGCQPEQVCNGAGQCFTCTTHCDQRPCGPDGCGGSCGECDAQQACGADFTCQDVTCTGLPGSIQGSLVTDAMQVAFDGAQVSLQHRRDMDVAQDGCIANIDVELTFAGGCRLVLSARGRYLDADGLEIRNLDWTADADCPGLAAAGQGTFQGAGGLTRGWIKPGVFDVPGSNAYSACVATSLVIELAGVIYRVGPGDPLTVSPSRIELQGDFTSMGNALLDCPCMSVCDGKQCGDDGCGFDCGQCPEATTYCDESNQCTDDCVDRQCGPSPVMGYSCGTCPQVTQQCLEGACVCPNLECQSECCAPSAVCYAGACCQPSCRDKVCGDDGCGGLCGTCPGNLTCQGGLCMGELDWVPIPAGSFLMGSAAGDASELPLHLVNVAAFEILRTEVTAAQYAECNAANPDGCIGLQAGGGCTFETDLDHPINCVTYLAARSFCAWAGGRLPSEAEWEYAARSLGQNFTYPWGDDSPTCERVIFDEGGYDAGCNRGSTWPVCSVTAGNTAQGLCDMAGNVSEILEDEHHNSYDGAPTDGSAWVDSSDPDTFRVARGGDWQDPRYDDLRCSHRDPFAPSWAMRFFGFRCTRAPQ